MKKLFSGMIKYYIKAYCNNCGNETVLKIPKGTYVYDFLKDKESICDNCGCRIIKLEGNDILDPDSLEKEHKRELMSLRERLKQKRDEKNENI